MLVIMKSCDMKILQRSSVRRRSRIRWLLVSVWWVTLLPALTGTEIAFTVQGRLTDEGKPAGGLYDFHFALKPAPEGETLAEWLERGVPVRDGLFTVPVAFRPAFFDVFALTADDPLEEARYLSVGASGFALGRDRSRPAARGAVARVHHAAARAPHHPCTHGHSRRDSYRRHPGCHHPRRVDLVSGGERPGDSGGGGVLGPTVAASRLVPGRERRHHRRGFPGNHRFAAP